MSQKLLESKLQEWREALRELSAAAAEAQKFARTKPLDAFTNVEPTDLEAMKAAFQRLHSAREREKKIAEEVFELRQQLDKSG